MTAAAFFAGSHADIIECAENLALSCFQMLGLRPFYEVLFFIKGGKRFGQGLREIVITGKDGVPRKHWVAMRQPVAHDGVIDGDKFEVNITVRIHSDGKRYYDHLVVEKKRPTGLPESGEKVTSAATPAPPFVGLAKSIEQSNVTVNGYINLLFPNGHSYPLAKSPYLLTANRTVGG
jgi:hypothetical protein